jgi:type II secretory pathway component PulC
MKISMRFPQEILKFRISWVMADISRYLFVLCCVLTLILSIDFMRLGFVNNLRYKKVEESARMAVASDKPSLIPPATLVSMMEEAKKKDLFTFAKVPRPVAEEGAQTRQAVEDLKLVAVVWSDEPQVVVESRKEAQSFILNVGDAVGPFRVKAIEIDKVVLEENGKQWSLK